MNIKLPDAVTALHEWCDKGYRTNIQYVQITPTLTGNCAIATNGHALAEVSWWCAEDQRVPCTLYFHRDALKKQGKGAVIVDRGGDTYALADSLTAIAKKEDEVAYPDVSRLWPEYKDEPKPDIGFDPQYLLLLAKHAKKFGAMKGKIVGTVLSTGHLPNDACGPVVWSWDNCELQVRYIIMPIRM